jgi:hypothetical protein
MANHITVYHWPEIKAYLQERLDVASRALENVDTDREMWRLQGRTAQLRELLNLPDTLTVLSQ